MKYLVMRLLVGTVLAFASTGWATPYSICARPNTNIPDQQGPTRPSNSGGQVITTRHDHFMAARGLSAAVTYANYELRTAQGHRMDNVATVPSALPTAPEPPSGLGGRAIPFLNKDFRFFIWGAVAPPVPDEPNRRSPAVRQAGGARSNVPGLNPEAMMVLGVCFLSLAIRSKRRKYA
jgi:hypothetical protein